MGGRGGAGLEREAVAARGMKVKVAGVGKGVMEREAVAARGVKGWAGPFAKEEAAWGMEAEGLEAGPAQAVESCTPQMVKPM